MQPPTAPPRDHLTAAQVDWLLLDSAPTVTFGAELLATDLTELEDISDDLAGGKVERSNYGTVHGSCRIEVSRELAWGVDLVRLWMKLAAGGIEARWNVGVYALTTPEKTVGETPTTFDVQGYDRVWLLDRQVGADYTVTAGTTYRQALLDTFAAAGLVGVYIEGSAADDTLPRDKVWPLVADDQADPDQTDTPVTWLRVVNDLLRAINFRAVWVDQDGTFRCGAYQEPSSRGTEFTFDANDQQRTIVGLERTVIEDVWKVPNRWVFRQSNRADGDPAPTEGDGIYTFPPSGKLDDGRDLTWTSVVDYEAASQAKLVSLGDRRVASDLRVASRVELTTGPFPGAGHFDVFRLVDAEVGNRKVQAVSWSMPLDGGDMDWVLETVAP